MRKTRIVGGFAAAALISVAARQKRALSASGAVAATVIGGLTVTGSGIRGASGLLVFFGSATALGRLPHQHAVRPQRRGNERDAIQVFANGGVSAVLSVASAVLPAPVRALLRAGYGGAIAAATADTWATEIGALSRQQPRSIATLQPVPAGASGGITVAGLAASAAGAATIAAVLATGGAQPYGSSSATWLPTFVGGLAGSIADSLLGARLQDVRYCERCHEETELQFHRCGQRTRSIRGLPWCDNDVVNVMATSAGAIVAFAAALILNKGPNRRYCAILATVDRLHRLGVPTARHILVGGRERMDSRVPFPRGEALWREAHQDWRPAWQSAYHGTQPMPTC